ncbi:golgin candidate 6-like isoform X2 [Euphorbia lathyris]|uniref:golgin candidate 6-like isoform X2 n=1 Tax=Euphorbia lathyris TaxID=212925 RepID=UPI003313DC72
MASLLLLKPKSSTSPRMRLASKKSARSIVSLFCSIGFCSTFLFYFEGAATNDTIGTVLCLIKQPNLIKRVHLEYLYVGADILVISSISYVERLLGRISNGVLAEDMRTAMVELQSVVAESQAAQLAFGAMGFPVLMGVLKEERDDVEMIRGALETLLSALTPLDHVRGPKNEVQPALMNTDLLSREAENISLLLSLLSEEDFYIPYYTLQILTALLTNSPNRLQEAILTIPRGITRLMDMLMDRESLIL